MGAAVLAMLFVFLAACGGSAGTSPASSGSGSVAPGLAATAATRRAAVSTPFGDPAELDLCQAQPTPIQSAGIQISETQYLGACRWNVSTSGAYFDISAYFEKPGYVEVGARLGSAGGITTYEFDKPEQCDRVLRGTNYEVSVEALNPQGTVSSEDYCLATRLITTGVTRLLTSGKIVKRPLASPSLARIDLCRTLTPARAAALLGARSVTTLPVLSKTSCAWFGDNNAQLLAQAETTTNYGTIAADTRVVGGHRLVSPAGGTTGCQRLSLQGGIARTKGREAVDIEVRRSANPCSIADRAASRILDALRAG